MRLKMKVGLSGSEYSLSPGDEFDFEDDAEGLRHHDADHGEFVGTDEELAAIREKVATGAPAVKRAAARETTAKKLAAKREKAVKA